jgi:predicted DNA-binding transcriptional regulator YafY
MRQAETLDQPASRPADFDIAAYWERSATEFREKLPQYHAVFLAKPSVMPWIRYRGWRLEEETPQGELVRVRLRFDADAEVLQFALSFGAGVELLEPAELRPRVLDAAMGMLALYK